MLCRLQQLSQVKSNTQRHRQVARSTRRTHLLTAELQTLDLSSTQLHVSLANSPQECRTSAVQTLVQSSTQRSAVNFRFELNVLSLEKSLKKGIIVYDDPFFLPVLSLFNTSTFSRRVYSNLEYSTSAYSSPYSSPEPSCLKIGQMCAQNRRL